MLRGITFILICLSLSGSLSAIPADLKKSNSLVLNEVVYYFGFAENNNKLSFLCHSYDAQLVPIDSFVQELGSVKAEQYHEIGTDTSHGFLNFWFQKINDEKNVYYLRLDRKLRLIYFNEKAEAARINSIFIYDDDKLYYRDKVYVIRSPRDSSHKFFLSCYALKDEKSFFDYEIKWGFRFYKFNYLRCKLLMADDEKVLVYVHALDGEKKGQYILSINAVNGELLKAAQFNDPESAVPYTYFFSDLAYKKESKEYFAAGVVTRQGAEADLLNSKKPVQLFFIVLDERAEVKLRIDDLAVLPQTALKSKDFKAVCVRVKDIHVTEAGQTEIISEVAGSSDGKKFRPYGYWLVSFSYLGGEKMITVNEFYNVIDNPANKLITRQPNDINGVFIIKSAAENDKTLFLDHLQEVIVGAKAEGSGLWLLAKRKDLNAKKIMYSEVKLLPGGKLEQNNLFDATFDEAPLCLLIDRSNALIFAKSKSQGLVFKKVGW